eukprot:3614938-Pyramimonas_sp.AAC.1
MGVTATPRAQLCLIAAPDCLGGCHALGPSQPLEATPLLTQVLFPVSWEVHALGNCTDGGEGGTERLRCWWVLSITA